MSKKAAILVIVSVILSAPLAYAASPWEAAPSYGEKVTQKLEFGLQNFLGGWTEIYFAPIRAKKDGCCVVKASGEGVINALIYTAGGVLHAATFLIPVDIPLPNNGIKTYEIKDPQLNRNVYGNAVVSEDEPAAAPAPAP